MSSLTYESIADQVAEYKDRGWNVHRVTNGKKPGYREWENTTHEPEQFKDSDNVGGKLGSKSGNRIAVDLDCPEAIALGSEYLPETAVSGKGSKRSHYVVVAAIDKKLQFYDIPSITEVDGKRKVEQHKIIEVLTNGQQMLLPPSIADDQEYSWKNSLEPVEIDADDLIYNIKLLATVVTVARNLPDKDRHDFWLALAGFLYRRGLPKEDILDIGTDAWEYHDAPIDAVNALEYHLNTTTEKIDSGQQATGGKKMEDIVPGLAKAISKVWGWTYSSKTDTPTQDELRDRVLDSHRLAATGLGWRIYQDGAWAEKHESQVRSLVADMLEDAKDEGVTFTAGLVTSVTNLVRDKSYVLPGTWDANRDTVVCKDHVLDLNTGTTREHSPEDYATSKLPFNYDPKARAPRWKRFLQDRFPDKATRALLQEFVGCALTTDNSLEIALWFVGQPGTGKSTLIDAVTNIMGERAGTLDIGDLGERFGLAGIPGKTLLTATEQPGDYLRQLNVLNKLISGETLRIEDKNVRGEDVTPVCKILWAMNDLPEIRNPENGIWRRIKIVEFPPLNSPPNESLKANLKSEAPGILAWAVQGLMRLRSRGRFVIPESVESATNEYQADNDIEAQFLVERCKVDLFNPDLSDSSNTLYTAYKRWAQRFGYMPKSQKVVAKEWRRLGLSDYRNNGTRWRGVEVKFVGADLFSQGSYGEDSGYGDEKGRIYVGGDE